ncbi:MAG: tRNA uridine-5-carboxymethylaminomethyl(34) synthesis GTPase MnmE [Bacilli bacterium]|nr:tRNA uridine-5-carboxymethylaminomethyl(34) synthesis GTPase MnmE [Bacilli bacterium]
MFETIVALATPPMKSALAIIRLSGDDVFNVVSKCFTKNIENLTKKEIMYGSIVDSDQKIDDVILLAYKGPKSFTGEDSVEIICHGSMLIANQIIQLLIKCGARLATNGEYSSRAFMHNKIDLVQAEAINDVINATTAEAKNLSLLSLDGKVSNKIVPLKTRLADVISLIEVNIDYPEYEDIEVANKDTIISLCDELVPQIDVLVAEGNKAKIIKEGIKVAIVGKPNVGKSSLLNALIGEEKAIVTDIAGTTRDIVEGDVNLNGLTLHLLDTAGIHTTGDKVENIGIQKAKNSISDADLVILVLDNSRLIDSEDLELLEETKNSRRIVVLNKSDIDANPKMEGILISAEKNNIQELVNKIKEVVGLDEQSFKTPALNNSRQIGLLQKAKEDLIRAKEDAESGLTMDLISVSILSAYTSILEILGEANQIDIAKEIFSRFCVGK